MRHHQDIPARVRHADDDELARLLKLYPNNARLVTLATAEQKLRRERGTLPNPNAYR